MIYSPANLQQAMDLAKYMCQSQLVPKDMRGKPGDVLVTMAIGDSIGLSPAQALQAICLINGRATVWGDFLKALCFNSPLCDDIIETQSDGIAVCTAIRRKPHGGLCKPIEWKFSTAMAKTAGLWGKAGPWTTHPTRMLQLKARNFACRDAFPDVLKGLQMREDVMYYGAEDGGRVHEASLLAVNDDLAAPAASDLDLLLADIASNEDLKELREICRNTQDATVRDACKARAAELGYPVRDNNGHSNGSDQQSDEGNETTMRFGFRARSEEAQQ